MAAIPEGVQVLFDSEVSESTSDKGSEDSTASSESAPRDYHREQYPNYVPPHARGHNLQQDKFVNFKNRKPGQGPDPDKVEGIDNDKYQKLKIGIPYALTRDVLSKLKADFPGVYFHCKDNGNHDHPFSHAVTMIGARLTQRRIRPGSRVLDVYGNPNACDTFNKTQVAANNPKSMKALVCRTGPQDFIREVNKWGPYMDDAGDTRYHRGTLRYMIDSGEIAEYNVLYANHTLYYMKFEDIVDALHAPCDMPGKRVLLGQVHRHSRMSGELNIGEQVYEKKVKMGVQLVKQTNVATNSVYIHPDLTPLLFREDKTWFPPNGGDKGLAWEMHKINDETWSVEMVPYVLLEQPDDVINYNDLWDMEDDDFQSSVSGIDTPASSIQLSDGVMVVPTQDGQFVKLEITNMKLFGVLRTACIGKKRDSKLLDEVIRIAKHHVNPSALFGDKEGLKCPPDKIFDHAVAAYMADLNHETRVMEATVCLRPVLVQHASKLKLGPKYKDLSIRDLFSVLQNAVNVGRDLNRIRVSKDPIDQGLSAIGSYLE